MYEVEKSVSHCNELIKTIKETLRELDTQPGSQSCQFCEGCKKVKVNAIRIENSSKQPSDSTTVMLEFSNLVKCLNTPLNPQNT